MQVTVCQTWSQGLSVVSIPKALNLPFSDSQFKQCCKFMFKLHSLKFQIRERSVIIYQISFFETVNFRMLKVSISNLKSDFIFQVTQHSILFYLWCTLRYATHPVAAWSTVCNHLLSRRKRKEEQKVDLKEKLKVDSSRFLFLAYLLLTLCLYASKFLHRITNLILKWGRRGARGREENRWMNK